MGQRVRQAGSPTDPAAPARTRAGAVITAAAAALAVIASAGPLAAPAPAVAQAPAGALEPYARIDQWPDRAADASGVLRDPVGLDVGPDDRVYVSDAGAGGVHVVLPGGQYLPPFGATGPEHARLGAAGKLAVSHADGRVYVLDTAGKRVVAYDLDGGYVSDWAGIDGAAIAAASDGRVYVADREHNRIQVFDRAGARLFAFGGLGTGDGQFTLFSDIGVSPDGRILAVGDQNTLRVQVFDVGVDRAALRTSYALNHPRYSPPDMGPPYLQCRATVVQALGDDDVWVGDGRGACRLTPDGHTYAIASTMADGTICKQSVRLPRLRPDTGQFVAVATYDPNEGPCYSARRGKDTRLPTTPAVVRFRDGNLAAVDAIALSSRGSRVDSGLVSPFVVSAPVAGAVFVQDRTRFSRYFAPDGADRGTVALTTRQGAGTTERYRVERAESAETTGEIFGYYRKERLSRNAGDPTATPLAQPSPTPGPARGGGGATWVEDEHGIGCFRNVKIREFNEVVDVLEPVWTNPFGTMSPERALLRQAATDSLAVIDVAFNPASGQVLALGFERMPSRRVDHARIAVVPADGTRRTAWWELPDDATTTFTVNPYVDLSVGPDGNVYALNDYADVAEAFAADGRPLARIPVAPDVRQIAGGPNGVLFGLREAGYVERYAPDGTVTARFDGRPTATSDPLTLTALAVDADGRVYVADALSSLVSVFAPAPPGGDVLPVPDDATCVVAGDKVADPTRIVLGEATTLRLTLRGACGIGEAPSDIVLVLLYHPPTFGGAPDDPAAPIIRELRRLVARIDYRKHRVGVVAYFGDNVVEQPLTGDPAAVLAAIQKLTRRWPGGCQAWGNGPVYCQVVPRLDRAMQTAQQQLEAGGERRRVMLLYQPQYCNRTFEYVDFLCRGYAPAETTAAAIRAAGTQVVVFDGNRTGWRRFRILPDRIPAGGSRLYNADAQPLASSDADVVFDFAQAQHRMVRYRVPDVLATDLAVTDTLPANMRLVPGSVSAPGAPSGADVTWTIDRLPYVAAPFTLVVEPRQVGRWPTNVRAAADFVDGWGRPGHIDFPVPQVEVVAPTATPTATATATPEPTETPTPAPTVAPTPTATPTAVVLRPAYLPIALREACQPTQRRADVALVLDASTSMLEPAGAGRTKLDAARDAARVFLGQLRLGAGDRAAIVSFNGAAALDQPLTEARADLDRALEAIQVAPWTRLDLGLATAHAELVGPRRLPGVAVIILLTDGRANPVPVEAAVDAARLAKADGILVFTVGLGDDLDLEALAAMASRPAYFFRAATADALADIYRDIAGVIPCPAEAFWGRRVSPP